jgi:hypothetical protein
MADAYHTDIRKQLLISGYVIIPNICKVPKYLKWNENSYLKKERTLKKIESWARRFPYCKSTGLLIRDGLLAIDIDVNDGSAVAALLAFIATIAPDVVALAPTRYGGGEHKITLVCRVDMNDPKLFTKIDSCKYFKPGEDPETADGYQVEIFSSKSTPDGHCGRQIGIYGPHTVDKNGNVLVSYRWAEDRPALHETKPADLPFITSEQAHAIIDAFELWADKAGWIRQERPDVGAAGAVYDITAETRFDTDRAGVGLTYTELCDAYAGNSSLRCTTSFIAGRHGDTFKCQVGDQNRHGCVAVYIHNDPAIHFPKELDPVAAADRFSEAFRAFAATHPEYETSAGTPLWREKFVRSSYPKPSFHNAKLAITHAGFVCSEDTFHHKLYIVQEPVQPSAAGCLGHVTDATMVQLRDWLSNKFHFDLTAIHVHDAVLALCAAKQYDPVLDMLSEAQNEWDGVERLDRLAVEHFNCDDTPLNRAFVRKFMIAAVARARVPGIKFDEIPVFESAEGWNKSQALAVLAGADNFADVDLLGQESREVIELTTGAWIVELSDLKNIKRADVTGVKAFASRQEDKARPAYGRFVVIRPRRFVVAGTTNEERYLLSQTGNRRFWPLRVRSPIDIAKLAEHRMQLWGEAAHLQSQGETLRLPQDLWAAAGVEQEARRISDTWEDVVDDLGLVPGQGEPGGKCIIRQVGYEQRIATIDYFKCALDMPGWRHNRFDALRLADSMRARGWERAVIKVRGKAVNGYRRQVEVAVDGKIVPLKHEK